MPMNTVTAANPRWWRAVRMPRAMAIAKPAATASRASCRCWTVRPAMSSRLAKTQFQSTSGLSRIASGARGKGREAAGLHAEPITDLVGGHDADRPARFLDHDAGHDLRRQE